MLAYPLGLLGAILGAIVGGFIVKIARESGFYALPLIGLTVGYGSLFAARRGGVAVGLMAGVIALAGQIVTEWYLFPWAKDPGLGYFLAHLGQLPTFKWLLYAVGTLAAGWIAWTAPTRGNKAS